MRIIARSTLKTYWEAEPGSEKELEAWYKNAKLASWTTPAEVKQSYGSASILKDGRVVFNISGNKYRLVVQMVYQHFAIYIRFVGSHKEYDKIDAQKI